MTADQGTTQTGDKPAPRTRSRNKTTTAATRQRTTTHIGGTTSPGSGGPTNAFAADVHALDRLSSAYVRGGNGQRTLGTCNLLEFIAWANEYASTARPRTMTAASGGSQV